MTYQQLVASLGLVACSLISSPAVADMTVAIAGPMDGQFRAFGAQMQAGAAKAVADINAAGGVRGEQLVLEVADDGCNDEQAVAVANQLIGKGAVFVAGHFCFGASIAASAVYADAGIVQISPATTLPRFTEARPSSGIFRLAPRDDTQALVAGQLLASEFASSRIAILHDKTAYGKGLTDAVKAVMNDRGVSESIALGFDAGEDDYRNLVTQLSLENVDVVYLGGYHPEAGLIGLEMARQGLDAQLIGGDALMTEEFWSVAGPSGEGTLLTYPEIPREIEASKDVVADLEEAGLSADRYALTTYAALQAWAQAMEQAADPTFEAVASSLENGAFETVLGTVRFDENGDANVPAYVWYEWQDGAPQLRSR
ncbi:branched-chain amino acid ABC transporter substrate-binding protein [Roseibium porphyridii]|uniref:Branched-chain amino acid ABC transporter substrate-binding protein n=1 Tax=Roseibium porphyridii TaxID=2866279 RepID=A0ABY8F9J5_9HYPH|nr:branched-chain amino acid ABC transporter substrate-binding protein [Roseibium sp. KMA01]WFE92172.1 branched-chain amino acid ABC transporter substrate-binding protein [Roseibium sp. KMA01]